MHPWFLPRPKPETVMQQQCGTTIVKDAELRTTVYQDSPARQALVQMATYNKFLDGLTAAVKAIAALDADHQQLALETMGKLMRTSR